MSTQRPSLAEQCAKSLGVEISDTRRNMQYEQAFTVYGDKEKCFFCPSPSTHISRIPSFYEYRAGKRTNDMRAYHVCPKCLARCNKMIGAGHEALIDYVQRLEYRGSVRGRVKHIPDVQEAPVIEKIDFFLAMDDKILRLEISEVSTSPDPDPEKMVVMLRVHVDSPELKSVELKSVG